MRKTVNKVIALTTIATLTISSLTGCGAVNTINKEGTVTASVSDTNTEIEKNKVATEDKTQKKETVYVLADASGAKKEVIVSEWLKNFQKLDMIEDSSDLQNIVNVKGEEKFTIDGQKVTWDAKGADIYYQGNSDKELPVTLNMTYTLDGNPIDAKDLAGKTGHVVMRMEYENHTETTVKVNGKDITVKIPFVVIGGMMLSDEHFSNVKVSGGEIVADGNNIIVAGLAVPGMKDSLLAGADTKELEDIELPEAIEVEADVTDFELDMTLSLIMNDLLSDIDTEDIENADDLTSLMNELTTNYDKIVDGSKELSDGLVTLQSSLGEYSDGVNTLKDKIPSLLEGIDQLVTGAKQLKDGAASLTDGTGKLEDGTKKLDDNVGTLVTGVSDTKDGVGLLINGYEGENGAVAGAKKLSEGSAQIDAAVGQLSAGVSDMYTTISGSIKQYSSDKKTYEGQLKEVKAGITKLEALKKQLGGTLPQEQEQQLQGLYAAKDQLTAGIAQIEGAVSALETIKKTLDDKKLVASVKTLNGATTELKNGAKALYGGVNKLYKGTVSLEDAMKQLSIGSIQLKAGTNTLYVSSKELNKGAKTLATGIDTLYTGTSALKDGSTTLSKGVNTLTDATDQLVDGVDKLANGGKELYDGITLFNEEAIQKIATLVNEDLEEIKENITAVVKASKEYNTYTTCPDTIDSSVKFIIETEGISK